MALIDHPETPKRRDHSKQLKELSDEAAEVFRLHEAGHIDSEEATRRLDELKSRHKTFLDRLVG
jgi:hypothetical protein